MSRRHSAGQSRRATLEPLESAIQAQLVEYLTLTGWTVWQMQLGSAGNGSVYCTPGIPDLYICRPGRALWVEVKRPRTGRLSAAQADRHAELRRAGQEVHTVRNLEELQRVLRTQQVQA